MYNARVNEPAAWKLVTELCAVATKDAEQVFGWDAWYFAHHDNSGLFGLEASLGLNF
jgi:hypothetical protein